MTLAALVGIGSGALHAVTGPDHVLSLAPLSAQAGPRAWRLGLRWGLGHALGTFVVAALALLLVRALDLHLAARWGDALGGAALLTTGGLALRRRAAAGPAGAAFAVGLVHGLAGGAAVLLLLPAMGHAPLLFLAGFAAGSTLAMATLTRFLAGGAAMLSSRGLRQLVLASAGLSFLLGSLWLARALV